MICPYLNDAVKLADQHYGFHTGRFTTTALQSIKTLINNSLNNKKPVLVAIYLSKAFDTVNNEVLLHNINALDLKSKYAYKYAKQADLQGGVLYHILFEL